MSPCTRRLSFSFAPAGIHSHMMTSFASKSVHSKVKPVLPQKPGSHRRQRDAHIEIQLEAGHEKGLASAQMSK